MAIITGEKVWKATSYELYEVVVEGYTLVIERDLTEGQAHLYINGELVDNIVGTHIGVTSFELIDEYGMAVIALPTDDFGADEFTYNTYTDGTTGVITLDGDMTISYIYLK